MNKKFFYFSFLAFVSCNNFGDLKVISKIPNALHEVSGVEYIQNTNLFWMHNDSGNSSKIYAITPSGNIKKVIKLKARNKDWEDITSDKKGNLYIGDFGNNNNLRRKLKIYKVNAQSLLSKKADVETINFKYSNQTKFPPKKGDRYFDAEAFFYFNNHFYIFTKSRVKDDVGKTNLYKIPAIQGNHTATLIDSYSNTNSDDYWITAADISDDGSKVALLSPKNVIIFSNFTGDNFFSGDVKTIDFSYNSQKEGVCFKDNTTLIITDEKTPDAGGNMYELKI